MTDPAAPHLNVMDPSHQSELPLPPEQPRPDPVPQVPGAERRQLRVTFDHVALRIVLEWSDESSGKVEATVGVRCTGLNELTWEQLGKESTDGWKDHCKHHRASIRARLRRLQVIHPVTEDDVSFVVRKPRADGRAVTEPYRRVWADPWVTLEEEILGMARDLRFQFSPLGQSLRDEHARSQAGEEPPLRHLPESERPLVEAFLEKEARLADNRARRREADRERLAAARAQLEAERHRREEAGRAREFKGRLRTIARGDARAGATLPAAGRAPRVVSTPPVEVRVETGPFLLQDVFVPVDDLRGYFLREQAARWWVSNQSDDLLALPHCRIDRLEYQIRTALRVIGPLRGRALLSDEVGLGKTIEAGVVLKEYLTRGLVRRFLVLTVPSLVDQWEEELDEKFGVSVATTNQPVFREDPAAFWRDQPAIVASLHTLKQPNHLPLAQAVSWDLLIVDEAHYLRNRASQAWQAVNALPRKFLLLLTATPVQNSLEELYNLVTLLQPGHLPSPREFRRRFVDPKRPQQPREPAELRRMLGQVMIRNTRANAGVNLPPRRAETVVFEADPTEREFWARWESGFRQVLSRLEPSPASLWGRLVLQAAGSSPDAWRRALEKFPDRTAARAWREQAPLEASWARKCSLLPPLAQGPGGVVIFTQFLETQAALVRTLQAAGVTVFAIHGGTPSVERQPITERFRQQGGALVLTHSGTEGRNLQFSHRLVNFDLPWNPMEIEQRIGRLHRLGQVHPVRICNLVQSGTLQEHLLEILQEKLNLFELVVGETGLILGDRFSSDEFAEEVFQRWRDNEGRVGEALEALGAELAAARTAYHEVKQLDATLFAHDYETL
jgi:hypothetical protein